MRLSLWSASLAVLVSLWLGTCTSIADAQTSRPTSRPATTSSATSKPASQPKGSATTKIPYPNFLREYAKWGRYRRGEPRRIQITPDGKTVLFLRRKSNSRAFQLFELDLKTKRESVLLTTKHFLLGGGSGKLSAREKALRERLRMSASGIVRYDLSHDGKYVLIPLAGQLYWVNRSTLYYTKLIRPAGKGKKPKGIPFSTKLSPDSKHVGFVRNDDLYVVDVYSGMETRLTQRSHPQILNGVAEFVAQEEMRRYRGYWWSPDSKFLVYQQTDNRKVERMKIMDPSRPYRKPQSWAYPRAGKTNASVRLGVIPLAGGKTTWIQWDRVKYPYLATVRWQKHSPLTLVVQNREQTESLVLKVDPKTGKTVTLHRETDSAWLNLDQQVPRWIRRGKAFLWSTERSGSKQLELRSAKGKLLRTLTPSSLSYHKLLSVDEKAGLAFIVGHAKDPTQSHVFRLSLRSMEARRLTTFRGYSTGVFQTKAQKFVLVQRPFAGKPSYRVYSYPALLKLGELKVVSKKAPFTPKIEITRVGRLRWYSLLVRPQNFDPKKKYPVVVHIYGGPGGQVVRSLRSAYMMDQWIADHGVIVVRIDGRGTPHRGRKWERVIKGNFVDIPLADQVEALQALGKKYVELDMSRVGIYGWSFGGYMSAMAVLRRPDIFKVGVAGAPVADWLDYDTHYTERYMGLPQKNAKGYKKSNVLTYASKLKRPLLLIHGTADDNVYFTHSLRLSDALTRAGRDHSFLPLAGFTHMVREPLMMERVFHRTIRFLLRHLQSSK